MTSRAANGGDETVGLLTKLSRSLSRRHTSLRVREPFAGPKLTVRSLSRTVASGDRILSDISLDVKAGEIVALIGPSGSGKSTLLRALNRLWEPAEDSIFLDGQDITQLPVVQVRRRVGMLFQTASLFDGTVKDNLHFGPSLQNKSLTDEEVVELLALANLDDSFASKSTIGLSGGQAQRVALARALANHPEVLLLDEPTSALDPAATLRIEEIIKELRAKTGLTCVWVSHSAEQVERVADRVILLVKGAIVDTCSPEELRQKDHPLVRQFMEGTLVSEA